MQPLRNRKLDEITPTDIERIVDAINAPSTRRSVYIRLSARTGQQNRALHKFFGLLADTLNDAGLDQRTVLKPSVSIPWTPTAVKEQLWRPIQAAMLDKQSTTKLEKQGEIETVHKVLMRHLAEQFGIEYISFPSHDPGYHVSAPMK